MNNAKRSADLGPMPGSLPKDWTSCETDAGRLCNTMREARPLRVAYINPGMDRPLVSLPISCDDMSLAWVSAVLIAESNMSSSN